MTVTEREVKLERRGDQVVAWDGDGEPTPVRIVWSRPLTQPNGLISILHAKKKKEVAFFETIDELDADSRAIVLDELSRRYFLPKVLRVLAARATFGNRYWDVETDRGRRQFLMKSPETNAIWVTEDRCILRDTLGNCYEIESMAGLDLQSREKAEMVL